MWVVGLSRFILLSKCLKHVSKLIYVIIYFYFVLIVSLLAPSAAPQNVSVSLSSATTLLVTWTPPLAASRNGDITQYTVALTTPGALSSTVTTSTTNHASFSNLKPNTVYSVRVAAHTSAGMGPYSLAYRITTNALGKGVVHQKYMVTQKEKIGVRNCSMLLQ